MGPVDRLRFWFHLGGSQDIARRYFVVNGFDGALTMLGLISGFQLAGTEDLKVMIGGCVGAAVALGVSGVTSAYLSEVAERQRSLAKLEEAMLHDLSRSQHARAARFLPLLIALVNGAAPLLLSLIIISPLWLAQAGVPLPLGPLPLAIVLALCCIFALGIFLGRIGGTHWLLSGMKALLIGIVTMLIILSL
jgi:predicted membrane protein (TIGR00267 family)